MKKSLSLILAFIVLSNGYNNIFAMRESDDPITGKDYPLIHAHFEDKFTSGDPHQAIMWSKPDKNVVVDLNTMEDRRVVHIYNIQKLLAISENSSFLKAMLKNYIDAQEIATEEFRRLFGADGSANIGKFTANVFQRLYDKSRNDPEVRRDIGILAETLGASEEDARESYLIVSISTAITSKFNNRAIWSFATGGAFLAGGIIFGAVAAAKGSGAALIWCPVIAGVLLAIAGIGTGALYIRSSNLATEARFKAQRVQNYAMILKQFYDYLRTEPRRVSSSNVFVTAVDDRKTFDNPRVAFEDKWWGWKWWNSNIRNEGSWCAFRTIDGLACAPVMGSYESMDGKTTNYFIDIFQRAIQDDRSIDYRRLKSYLEGYVPVERPRQATAIAATAANKHNCE